MTAKEKLLEILESVKDDPETYERVLSTAFDLVLKAYQEQMEVDNNVNA